MPTRETIICSAAGQPDIGALRATIVRPNQPDATRQPLVVIHRGLVSSEANIDFLDHLADSIARNGIIAVLFEPRASELILDDFHAFSLEQSIADLSQLVAHCRGLTGVDGSRIGITAWAFGATTAIEAACRAASISRVCLINPATPAFIVNRAAKPTANADDLPQAVVQRLTEMVEEKERPTLTVPTLIVHAAADRVVPATVSESYIPQTGVVHPLIERLLIARADHSFTEAGARAACVERVCAYFNAMAPVEFAKPASGAAA